MKTKKDVYEIVTEKLITALEAGTAPWHKSWGTSTTLPANFQSGKKYRGINTFLLNCAGFSSPYWLTYKQAKEKGGNVKKGEKGMPVVFWNWIYKDANGKTVKGQTLPLTPEMRIGAEELTKKHCADESFAALCKRLPTLDLNYCEAGSTRWHDLKRLRTYYRYATGRNAFPNHSTDILEKQ